MAKLDRNLENITHLVVLFCIFTAFTALLFGVLPMLVPYGEILTATSIIVNGILTIVLIWLYFQTGITQSKQHQSLVNQAEILNEQESRLSDHSDYLSRLSELQRQQTEILSYQRMMSEQSYNADLEFEVIGTAGDFLQFNLENIGPGLALNIHFRVTVVDYGITTNCWPTFPDSQNSFNRMLRAGESEELQVKIASQIPSESDQKEYPLSSAVMKMEGDGMGEVIVKIELVHSDAGGDEHIEKIYHHNLAVYSSSSLEVLLGLHRNDTIPDIYRDY